MCKRDAATHPSPVFQDISRVDAGWAIAALLAGAADAARDVGWGAIGMQYATAPEQLTLSSTIAAFLFGFSLDQLRSETSSPAPIALVEFQALGLEVLERKYHATSFWSAMMRRDQFIPQLITSDGAGAMAFYKSAFGAEEVSRTMTPDGKKLVHGEMALDGHLFYVSDEFDQSQGGTCKSPHTLGGTGVRITILVDDADQVFRQAVTAGARALLPVQDMFWGGRYGKLIDPFGHEWGINQQKCEQTEGETQKAADEYFEDQR
jgi:PhnB protein